MLKGGRWVGKVVLKKGKVYIPKNKALKLKVILIARYGRK